MDTSTPEYEAVVRALARFRALHEAMVEEFQDDPDDEVTRTEYAYELAADGEALARAVAALLSQPTLQSLYED